MSLFRTLAGVLTVAGFGAVSRAADPPPLPAGVRLPTVPDRHPHARALLANALQYADPAHKQTDPASGYPFEGWNHDPKAGVHLRSFTQLTAIGLWLELLAVVAVGEAEVPFLSPDQALTALGKAADSLRADQRNPTLAAEGLLVNFLDLGSGKRVGPLRPDVDKVELLTALGQQKGEAVWQALVAAGWLAPRRGGTEAEIKRGANYGWEHFDGPLAPFKDEKTKKAVMDVLDRRAVTIIFGDNANLSTSIARTVGALLLPAVKDRPGAAAARTSLERFLDDQGPGYTRAYDPQTGLFFFGRHVDRDRMFGWEDLHGAWQTGHMDYMGNEFRGPTRFLVARFGLPTEAFANLGFKLKPYTPADGRVRYVLAPWEGSAFQALGLTVPAGELSSPSWRALLRNMVDVETDYSTRHGLPGFLSESYTGDEANYTGEIGIPAITVSPKPRLTTAASLYTLGPAYMVSPDQMEGFLAANWPTIRTLLTPHGPWEGYETVRKQPIRFQTTAHTLSLALGLLGTGDAHLQRYLEVNGLDRRANALFRPAPAPVDLLAAEGQVYAWAAKGGQVQSAREAGGFRVRGEKPGGFGLAFVLAGATEADLSGSVLTLRYRSTSGGPITIDLKPANGPPDPSKRIPIQAFAQLADTGGREEELRIPLPATPGLHAIKEVVLSSGPGDWREPVDLTVTHARAVRVVPTDPMGSGASR